MFAKRRSTRETTVSGNSCTSEQEVRQEHSETPNTNQCGPLPGSIVRIFIPPGAVINLLNLVEIASPGGVCLIVRLPFLGGGSDSTLMNIQSIISAIQAAGGTMEFTS